MKTGRNNLNVRLPGGLAVAALLRWVIVETWGDVRTPILKATLKRASHALAIPAYARKTSRNCGGRVVAHCLPGCLTLGGVCPQMDQPAGFFTPPIFLTKTSQIRFTRLLPHRKISAAEKITGSCESSEIFWSRWEHVRLC